MLDAMRNVELMSRIRFGLHDGVTAPVIRPATDRVGLVVIIVGGVDAEAIPGEGTFAFANGTGLPINVSGVGLEIWGRSASQRWSITSNGVARFGIIEYFESRDENRRPVEVGK